MPELPSLNGLRVFEVVARHPTFRHAAEELSVTQGAVAQKIRQLENELGVRLFRRLPRHVLLTDEGARYIGQIRQAFQLMENATRSLKRKSKSVTISVAPSFASRWLLPRLSHFTTLHEDIDLKFLATEKISDLDSGEVDLAVRYGQPPFTKGLVYSRLFAQSLIAVASPKLLEHHGEPVGREDFGRFVLLHDSHNYWPEFLKLIFVDGEPMTRHNIHFNQTALAIEAAVSGQGLALAERHFVSDELDNKHLKQVFSQNLDTGKGFYLVYPEKAAQRPEVNHVKNWFLETARHEIDR